MKLLRVILNYYRIYILKFYLNLLENKIIIQVYSEHNIIDPLYFHK